ncbi:MAG: hypothetical protein V5786_05495 [Psychromonas sp.]
MQKKILLLPVILSTTLLVNPSYASTKTELQAALAKQQQEIQAIEIQIAKLSQQKSEQQSEQMAQSKATNKNWEINSYGSLLYKSDEVFRNIQDTDPDRRATMDLERVVLEFVYNFDSQWQIETEIEFEHGGTGVSLEYDGFEEFGEFETEIEAGGEVIVEKLQVKYQYNQYFTVKMGHIFVPVGLGTDLHKPSQFFSTERSWSESTMIPQVWHETGVNLVSQWQDFTLQTLVTTGLNSEYFRTYNWVATGHQKRFEKVNADDLALTIRLDYGNIKAGKGFGFSFYTGNTSGNRNNSNKIVGDGNLTIFGVHGAYQFDRWSVRGQYLFGQLDDSSAITEANKTTAGLQPGNFASLGSEADSSFIELAYNTQGLFNISKPLYLFSVYQYSNPIKALEQGVPTERFDQEELAFGVNFSPVDNLIFKAQFAERAYAQAGLDNTRSFSLSMGYFFSI